MAESNNPFPETFKEADIETCSINIWLSRDEIKKFEKPKTISPKLMCQLLRSLSSELVDGQVQHGAWKAGVELNVRLTKDHSDIRIVINPNYTKWASSTHQGAERIVKEQFITDLKSILKQIE